ncbi:hypothetical protein HN827_03795 [archaeon]|nr:hypothetical protein [archaeon]MBT7391927.1 hypothetical protein [archaeon]
MKKGYVDIDDKYDERKEVLFEKFRKRHGKASKKRKVRIKKWYDRSLKRINSQYKRRTDNFIKKEKFKKNIKHKFSMKSKPLRDKIMIFMERFKKKKEEEKK